MILGSHQIKTSFREMQDVSLVNVCYILPSNYHIYHTLMSQIDEGGWNFRVLKISKNSKSLWRAGMNGVGGD